MHGRVTWRNMRQMYTVCSTLYKRQAAARSFPAKVSFTWQSACCSAFLLTLLSALHMTTMSEDDMIAHLLNDGGVDSAALAEVMTD